MGAEFSQAVKSDLRDSTLKELLSDEKFVERVREAVPVLDDNVQRDLRKLLTKNPAKRRPVSASKESPLLQDAIVGLSAQEDVPQEAAAAGINTTTSGAATDLSAASDVASPTSSASLGERALSNAALVEDHRTRPLWEIKEEEVALPSEIAKPFERWKADPSAFLRSDGSHVPLSLKEHYDYALSVRTSTISNKILWRFITTVYYNVISTLSQSERYSITKEAVAFVVAVICESPLYDRNIVKKNIISWAKDGAKYRALANRMGGLCCYFFYPDISEWIWIKHLPQNAYDKAAKLLLNFGIFEKAQQSGAVDLGKSIEAILKAPFQCAVPAQSHGQWILPIPPQQINSARNIESCEIASGPCNRKSAEEETSSGKRQRTDTRTQRPSLPTTQSCQDLVAGEKQVTDSHSTAHDARSSSPQSLRLASPQLTIQSHGIDSTPSTTPSQSIDWTTESQQSPALNHVNYEAFEQPVASVRDPNRSYNIQPETNQSDQGMSSRLRLRERKQHSEGFIPYFTQDAGLTSKAWIPAAPFADNEFVFHSNRNDVQGFFSPRSRVLHSPSPPQALLVAENLLHNIKVYFENSCRNMILDHHGTLLNPNGAELHNDLCNEFDSYCFTATMFIGRKLHVDFRHALSKASALVEQILRAEHPRTLACFLEVFIHLIQTGLPEVTSFLRDFIQRMSVKVTRKEHPWGQICRLLGGLDSESLDQAMAQIWKCTTDTFESELGTFSRLAVSVRLDYIKRVYGFTNYLGEEWLLRDLLAQFDGNPRVPTPRVMLNLAHNLNRQGRYDEAEEMALEVLSLLQEYEIYAKRIVERIECMKIVSCSQFNQGKTLAAEQTMREAIRMIVDQWGIQHSWVVEFMNVLEGWLRDWGREEDANTQRGEIEELMGKDEIDEQLDRVQGLLC